MLTKYKDQKAQSNFVSTISKYFQIVNLILKFHL
jgi:hypothetical protein